MSESYRAFCSDFYINMKLGLKLDLPTDRQAILDMFDRVRREYPSMDQFRRYTDELALESNQSGTDHLWLAIRSNNIRTGAVNPDRMSDAYTFHRRVLEVSPYFLTISPLDAEFIELLFGFDLFAAGNHDEIVSEALFRGSKLASLLQIPGAMPVDCQPVIGVVTRDDSEVEVHFEVKTRTGAGGANAHASGGGAGILGPTALGESEPISVYLTLRKRGPVTEVADLARSLDDLAARGEELVGTRVIPHLVTPLREAAGSH